MTDQTIFEVYRELLPETFLFPNAFNDAVLSVPLESEWWFLTENPDFLELCFKTINEKVAKGCVLIPFAKSDELDCIACFDGLDKTGHPRIFTYKYEDSLTDLDWKNDFKVPSFEHWLTLWQET